jgi:hypothetical protein
MGQLGNLRPLARAAVGCVILGGRVGQVGDAPEAVYQLPACDASLVLSPSAYAPLTHKFTYPDISRQFVQVCCPEAITIAINLIPTLRLLIGSLTGAGPLARTDNDMH